MVSAIQRYDALRDDVTQASANLFDTYRSHLACKRGCYFCCDPITVLPVEIHSVRRHIATHGAPEPEALSGPPEDNHPRCHFLGKDGACTIYEARPLICRTHGLPLSYRVYEYDESGQEIDPDIPKYTELWCDLNFTGVEDEEMGPMIDASGAINMHLINEQLERIKESFLLTQDGEEFRGLPAGEERLQLVSATQSQSSPPAEA